MEQEMPRIEQAHSIVKDFEIRIMPNSYLEGSKTYRMRGKVVFKRGDILWETLCVMDWEVDTGTAEEMLIAIHQFNERTRRIYHMYMVDPDRKEMLDLRGRRIGEIPCVIEDEYVTKEEYETKFNVKLY